MLGFGDDEFEYMVGRGRRAGVYDRTRRGVLCCAVLCVV